MVTTQQIIDRLRELSENPKLLKQFNNDNFTDITKIEFDIGDNYNYSGNPFVFPNKETIDSYIYQLNGTLKEGTIDIYVDSYDEETYVMECHKFFSCGLYGFSQLDILPLMFWRTYKELIK